MSGKNYNQIFKDSRTNTEVSNEASDPVVNPVTNPVEEPKIDTMESIVVDCEKLNIRMKPDITSRVYTTVDRGSKLTIFIKDSTENWYSVRTENGVEGFCMKKYVK